MTKIIKALVLAITIFAGTNLFAAGKKTIVCTTFPEYDWTMNILGNCNSAFEVTLLQNKGTDLHSFQPSFKDIAKISTCDMFIYVGGESDEWVEDALSNSKNKNMTVINMLNTLGERVKEEEIVEGMQAEEEEGEECEEEIEYDEHVWLSVKNAVLLTSAISQEIQNLDSANSEAYKANTSAYIGKLQELDNEFTKTVSDAKFNTVLFGDRFPFRYLVDDYNLKYYAAFVGCSAESEASFETIKFLADKVDSLGLNTILTIEKSDKKIAKTIAGATKSQNKKILEMDSLQSVNQKEIKNGKNYISAMKNNLETLKAALN